MAGNLTPSPADITRLLDGEAPAATAGPDVSADAIWNFPRLRPRLLNTYDTGYKVGETTHFDAIDPHFTWKAGELIIFTGYANHGKTAVAMQLVLAKAMIDAWDWGIFSPENLPEEEQIIDLIEAWVGQTADKRYPWRRMPRHIFDQVGEAIMNHVRPVYPKVRDLPTILAHFDRLRADLAREGRKLRGVVIDPWNSVRHPRGSRDDQYLDDMLTDLKDWAVTRDLCLLVTAHPKNPDKKGLKALDTPPAPDAYDLAGGAMWNNKADIVVTIHRPEFKSNPLDPSVQFIVHKVKKPKLVGVRGTVYLKYNVETQRYTDDLNRSPFPAVPVPVTVGPAGPYANLPAATDFAAPPDNTCPI